MDFIVSVKVQNLSCLPFLTIKGSLVSIFLIIFDLFIQRYGNFQLGDECDINLASWPVCWLASWLSSFVKYVKGKQTSQPAKMLTN